MGRRGSEDLLVFGEVEVVCHYQFGLEPFDRVLVLRSVKEHLRSRIAQ